MSINAEYQTNSKQEGFNTDEWVNQKWEKVNEWYRNTAGIIDSTFHSNSHYLFHFLNTERTALSITGIPRRLSDLIITLEKHLSALEDIIIRLEEKENLQIRKEIAEAERELDVLYKITYNDHTRFVKLNNIILTKTDFNSENDNAFQHIYLNPNRPIKIEEIEKAVGGLLMTTMTKNEKSIGQNKRNYMTK